MSLAAITSLFGMVPTSLAEDVQVGIQGHYRVGRWTGIRADQPFDAVETRDGDGVQVVYRHHQAGAWKYAIPGSEAAPLILRQGSDEVASTRFPTEGSPSRGPAMIPLDTPWIVVFGDPLTIDQIGANEILGRDALLAVSKPQSAEEIPDSVLGYDGVDMMLINGSAAELLGTIDQNQQQAIVDWVTGGGWLFLTLGQSSPDLLDTAPWLGSVLPFDSVTTTTIEPSAIETFTTSQTPLEPFVGARLPRVTGRILIQGRTVRREITPVAVEYIAGFGRVIVVAADLEDPMFADWPDRMQLLTELTGTILIPKLDKQVQKSRATAYNDLAGQLRATLDQFEIKRKFSFSMVSLVLMALLAIIGPLDYLLINRVLGRPLLGWLTFPIVAIGLSVLLVLQSRPVDDTQNLATRPVSAKSVSHNRDVPQSQVRVNRMEFFDIDAIHQVGRGFSANYIYTHDANRFDVSMQPSSSLSQMASQPPETLVTPFGFPGESYGGIQIAIEDTRLPVYEVDMRGNQSTLRGLPLASRSSKGISGWGRFQPTPIETSLQHRPGSELLQGELINPLPVDLLDGMLIYRNWAYLLPTRLRARGRVASVDLLRQKNFRWQLSRQTSLENSTQTEAWDTSRTDSPMRIAEMLLFHNAVGGTRYTTLRHDPLSFLDLSHVLTDDRCILVGRVAEPLTELNVSESSTDAAENMLTDPSSNPTQSVPSPAGRSLSIIRVVLPVRDAP